MSPIRIVVALALVVGAGIAGYVLSERALTVAAVEGRGPAAGGGALGVQVAPIITRTFTDRLMAVGTTRAGQAVDLRVSTEGQIAEILFEPGQLMRRGEALLRIDDAEAQASKKAAEATLSEARTALDRQESLSQSGSGARAALDAARAAFMRAEADAELAAAALADHVVTAPFDGVAGLSDLTIGQHVDASSTITTLDDARIIEVSFSVPERVMAELAIGQTVALSSDTYPDRAFTGTITAIDTRVDQSTRSRALRAEVANDDGALVGGMFVKVFPVYGERRAAAVPEEAVLVTDGEAHVYLARDNVAHLVRVETGAMDAGLVEIRSGLPETGEVIVTNLQKLTDGARIDIARPGGAALTRAEGVL